jgi:hypothetical protein
VAIADNDIWAVGDSTASGTEQPFAARFNGTSWSAVRTPTLSTGNSFADVAAVASKVVWAVGSQNVANPINTFIEHWDGMSWSVVSVAPSGVSGALDAAAALSDGTVVVVSGSGAILEN